MSTLRVALVIRCDSPEQKVDLVRELRTALDEKEGITIVAGGGVFPVEISAMSGGTPA